MSSSTREQYKMEDNIDKEGHDLLKGPSLKSVLPDFVMIKREIIDFDIGEETPIKTENQLDSSFEANSGNPPLMCSTQDLDVKPDILCTDIDDTLTVWNNVSESEIVDSQIKKESEIIKSTQSLFYRNKMILHKIIKDDPDEEHKKYAPSQVNVFNNEYKTYSEPDTAVVIKTDEDRSRSITKQYYDENNYCLQAKILLTDCYPSLLHNKCYCAQCAILFPSTKAYSEHNMSTHTKVANSTKASAALVGRKKVFYTAVMRYECSTCKKSFRKSSHLSRHNLIHTGKRPFECKTCKKTFRERSNLNRHNLIHTGEKRFECTICNKTFTQRNSLRRHKTIHTGEKPFECTICKIRFSQRSHLNTHKLIHTGEKGTFECTICSKTFRKRSCLRRHNLTHTGEKPFECKTCKKTFSQRSHLITHNLIHTGKPFECKT